MAATTPPLSATYSQNPGRQSAAYSATSRLSPPTALLIEYYEQHANKDSNLPSVRVRVHPHTENQQSSQRMSYISPLPTRENTVIDHGRAVPEESVFEQHQPEPPQPPNNPDHNRGRQRTRQVSEQVTAPIDEEEEPLPALPYQSPERRDVSDPLLPGSVASNDIVSSRQFQAIIASAIQELILPEIQAVRNELTAQAQLFHHQPGLQQASNQATFGTSSSGLRKRSRSLTALDAPLHRRNSMSIGTMDGFQGEVVPLPPRPTSPNVPAAMEAESLMRADIRSELKLTPPGTAHREQRRPTPGPSGHVNRLSGITDGPPVVDPPNHSVFNLAEGAYRKRESHEERMIAAKARRAAEKRARGEPVDEEIPEDAPDVEEATPERTRFSMLTADRPSESVIDDYETRSINRDNPNDPNIVSLQGQLNEMFHHLKASATERSERESDILAQVSVLAEDTRRTMQLLKDTILEETNVTVGALSYNIERYVGRIQYGPRPFNGKPNKALGKSASYPQDDRTAEQTGPIPPLGPAKRTATFLQGLGNAFTPSPGRAAREKRENMERLEAMVLRVLEEVEMLKRMKQGARRKTNGEMFKGEARTRLNPPEDALTYMDEVRGDTANRERGESEQERMARIENSARDFEEEKAKRTQLQGAIATETSIIRQSSKEVRRAQDPVPEGSQPYQYPQYDESERRAKPVVVMPGQPLPGLRMDQVGNLGFRNAGMVAADIPPQRGVGTDYHEDDATSPSGQSYRHGDDQHFTRDDQQVQQSESSDPNSAERDRMNARLNQVHDDSRKISVVIPTALPSTEDPTRSARESGVLGEHLEGEMGGNQTQSWIDRQSSAPPTPLSKDERYKSATHRESLRRETNVPRESAIPMVNPVSESYEDPGPSRPGIRKHSSQYYIADENGRRTYKFGAPIEIPDKGLKFGLRRPPPQDEDVVEWGRAFKSLKEAVSPKKKKDKGKEKETVQMVPENQEHNEFPSRLSTPLPSLFATVDQMETSPSRKLKKRFRKPIVASFGLKDSPVSSPNWQALGVDVDTPIDDARLSAEEKKARRSWREAIGFTSSKHPASPKQPATLPRSSVGEVVHMTYPGPSQEVRGRNGYHANVPIENDQNETTEAEPSPTFASDLYRDSISEKTREYAMMNMQLSEELAAGRHPGSCEVPSDVQWTLDRQARQAEQQQLDRAASQNKANENREFTPTPQKRESLPAAHLIRDDGLLPTTKYGPTEPLNPIKLQSSALPAPPPSPPLLDDGPLFDPAVIRDTFKSSLQRRPTPPKVGVPLPRAPRLPSGLNDQRMARTRRPSTLKHEQEQLASSPLPPVQQSPIRSESSYKTANDKPDPEPLEEEVRLPSTYSHDSIGGDRFSRPRVRTPPDTRSSADYSNSTRPLGSSDPPAPARYTYNGNTPPRSSPRGSHLLSKPTRVPSGPRVAPPNFATLKPVHREERYAPYSRPSFTSDYTRPTSEETDEVTAVVGHAVKTDLRAKSGSVSPNWVRTRKTGEVSA